MGHQALRTTVFVDYDGQMHTRLLEHLQRFERGQIFGHKQWLLERGLHIKRLARQTGG
jgi:hypothetical protein